MSVPKIQQTPATPQCTPCERHLSTVAETAESELCVPPPLPPLPTASVPRSASADGETQVLEPAPLAFRSRAMSGDTVRMVRR